MAACVSMSMYRCMYIVAIMCTYHQYVPIGAYWWHVHAHVCLYICAMYVWTIYVCMYVRTYIRMYARTYVRTYVSGKLPERYRAEWKEELRWAPCPPGWWIKGVHFLVYPDRGETLPEKKPRKNSEESINHPWLYILVYEHIGAHIVYVYIYIYRCRWQCEPLHRHTQYNTTLWKGVEHRGDPLLGQHALDNIGVSALLAVCMRMLMHKDVDMDSHAHMTEHVCVCVSLFPCVFLFLSLSLSLSLYIYIYIYFCLSLSLFPSPYVYIYIYTSIYMHTMCTFHVYLHLYLHICLHVHEHVHVKRVCYLVALLQHRP